MAEKPRHSAAYTRDFKDITRPHKVPGDSSSLSLRDMDIILQQINDAFRSIVTKIYGRIGQDDFNVVTQDYINNKVSEEQYSADLSGVLDQVGANTTSIQQNAQAISLAVSREEYDKQTESILTEMTQLVQSANELALNFTTISSIVNNNEASLETINKYIRFVDGDIILGIEGNELILHLENNRISYKYSGVEAAYFSDKRLVISNEGSVQRMEIGVNDADPFLHIYDASGVRQLAISKTGIQFANGLNMTQYTVGTKTGLGFYI